MTCPIWLPGSRRVALSLDKVRSLLGVATPENEAGWAEAAAELSYRDLGELVRSKKLPDPGL